MSIASLIEEIARAAKEASRILKNVERRQKDEALTLMASRLIAQRDSIKAENAKDLTIAREKGLSSAMIDRLTLDDNTINAMAESLRVVSEVTGNTLMKRAVHQSRERILAGADIATPLRDSGVIDPAIAHMVSVGEKSGELEKMLKSISDNLEASTDLVIERLSAAVEPLIIIAMAAIIGVIAYATILPILEVSSGNF